MTDFHPGLKVGSGLSKDTKYLIKYLRGDHSHREKIAQLLKYAEVNKGKVKSLSKRNQKRLLSRFGWVYNIKTGKLVDELKQTRAKDESIYRDIPVELWFMEKSGPPLDSLMNAWVNNLLKD